VGFSIVGVLFIVVCRGFLCVFFVVVGFFDLACIYTEFFVGVLVVGVLVVGFFHCGVFIYGGLWCFCFCCGGSSTLIESCLLCGFSPGLQEVVLCFVEFDSFDHILPALRSTSK
jgi:hypothetical protein